MMSYITITLHTLQCGLPVVCTDVGGSKEVISKRLQDGRLVTYGKVVPPRNPVQLAEAQLEVMAMLGGLQRLVQSGHSGHLNPSHQSNSADKVAAVSNETSKKTSNETSNEESGGVGGESVVHKLQSALGKVNHGRRVSITSTSTATTALSLSDYARQGPAALLRRIRSQRTNCRLLGMKFREFVLSNFTMSR